MQTQPRNKKAQSARKHKSESPQQDQSLSVENELTGALQTLETMNESSPKAKVIGLIYELLKTQPKANNDALYSVWLESKIIDPNMLPNMITQDDIKEVQNRQSVLNQIDEFIIHLTMAGQQDTSAKPVYKINLYMKLMKSIPKVQLKTAAQKILTTLMKDDLNITIDFKTTKNVHVSSVISHNIPFFRYSDTLNNATLNNTYFVNSEHRAKVRKMLDSMVVDFWKNNPQLSQKYILESDISTKLDWFAQEDHLTQVSQSLEICWNQINSQLLNPLDKMQILQMYNETACKAYYDYFKMIIGSDLHMHKLPALAFGNVQKLMQYECWDPLTYDIHFSLPFIQYAHQFSKTMLVDIAKLDSNDACQTMLYGVAGSGKSVIGATLATSISNAYQYAVVAGQYQQPAIQTCSFMYTNEVRIRDICNDAWKELLDIHHPMVINIKNTHPFSCTKYVPVITCSNDEVMQEFSELKKTPKAMHAEAIQRRLYPIRFSYTYTQKHPELNLAALSDYEHYPWMRQLIEIARPMHKFDSFHYTYMNFLVGFALNSGTDESRDLLLKGEYFDYYQHCDRMFRRTLFGEMFLCGRFAQRLHSIATISSQTVKGTPIEYTFKKEKYSKSVEQCIDETIQDYTYYLRDQFLNSPIHYAMFAVLQNTHANIGGKRIPDYLLFSAIAKYKGVADFLEEYTRYKRKPYCSYNVSYSKMLRNREEDYHFMNDDDSNEDEEMIHHDIQMAAQGME